MKIKMLIGGNYIDASGKEKRVEVGDTPDVPDKAAKAFFQMNAAVPLDKAAEAAAGAVKEE